MTEFVIIVESEADFRTASELANRIFIEQIEWIEPYLPQQLQWRGIVGETKFTCWKDIRSIYDEMKSRGIRPKYCTSLIVYCGRRTTIYKLLF